MPTELEQVRQFFKGYNIPLSNEWLESCMEWCKDDNLPPNYTIKDLQTTVYQQWLILDLRDVEIAVLPRNLVNEKKYILSGTYGLQIMQVVDISKPKLWQIQRIRNNVAKNTEQERDFGKRVLQLTLTDGVQQIEAMEFKPIPCLSINMTPGSKIKLMGPITVRNGRLMLKEENVKHLGGAVDELQVKYAAENVLARALGLEENPNPFTIDEAALEITEANTTTQTVTQNSTVFNQNRNRNQTVQRLPENISQNTQRNNQNIRNNNPNLSRSNPTPYQRNNQEIPPEFQVDDELLRELEEDFEENSVSRAFKNNKTQQNARLLKTPPNPTNKKNTISSNNNKSRNCSSPDLFEDMEVDDELLNEHLDQIDVDHMTSNVRSASTCNSRNSTKKLGSSEHSTKSKEKSKPNTHRTNNPVQEFEISSSAAAKNKKVDENEEVIRIEDDSFEDIDIDSHLDNIDEEMANLPTSTQIRNDFKERLRSPELKLRKTSSTKQIDDGSPTLSFKRAQKKSIQGTLRFGVSKDDKNIPSTSKSGLNLPSRLNLDIAEDEISANPFSIFKKPIQKGNSNSPQKSDASSVPRKLPKLKSPEFQSRNCPSTSHSPSEPQLNSPPSNSKVLPIEKLKKMIGNVGKGKFKVKGKFKTVAEKLRYTEKSYHFVIVIEDVTGDLTVQMHSDLVTSITGVEPKELERLRELTLKNNDVDVRKQIVKVLKTLHNRCMTLDNILEIQVTRGEKHPVVINIL